MILGPSDLYEISGPGTTIGQSYCTNNNVPIIFVNHNNCPNVFIDFCSVIELLLYTYLLSLCYTDFGIPKIDWRMRGLIPKKQISFWIHCLRFFVCVCVDF